MDFGCHALCLAPRSPEASTILVEATDAIRLCREGGYEEIGWTRACEEVARLARGDMGNARTFVLAVRLTTYPLSLLDDTAVLALLTTRVRQGVLVALREDPSSANELSGAAVEQRRLIARIDARTRGKLSYQGRQYKLVADVDLTKLSQRDSFEVVERTAAVRVLDGIASQPGSSPELRPLLAQARDKLSVDWRPPHQPDGLILLRRENLRVAARPDTDAAITPSQMKRLLEKPEQEATLEIVVVGANDKPFEGVEFIFAAPDEEEHKGNLGKPGTIAITSRRTGAGAVTVWLKNTP